MSKSSKRDSDEDFLKPRNAEDAKWMELMNRHDIVGIRYLRVGQLKRKRKLNKAERKFLAEFEADRKKIMRDPDAVWKKGFDLAHRGILLLNMLLYEKGLQNYPGIKDMSAYNAMTTLWGLGVDLREDFVRYAEDGSAFAAHFIFSQGKELASAFSRLAIAYPEHFRKFAERSLTMPSLRGRNPAFTCDAEAIIAAIHLAEKHHASNLHDNRSRIGALCHQFVAHIVDLVEACRLEARQKGHTDSKWWNFPELKGNAKAVWKAELKEWVNREFEKMKKNPRRNPALWQELEKLTDNGTESAKRAALEKYCFNKLEQIAGKASLAGLIFSATDFPTGSLPMGNIVISNVLHDFHL